MFCYNLAMIIDFHTHVFPPQINENRDSYIERDPCFAALYSNKKAKLATAEELIENMDRDGVDVSAVLNIGWSTNELCVETNNYILEAIARYPQRLVGFCTVQPRSINDAVNEIERCVRNGIRGIGEMRPDTQQIDLSDKQVTDPFVEVIKKHNLILLIHASEPVGHQYPGKGTVTPESLYPFIAAYPEITTVCAHWGGGLPFYALMPEVKKVMENTYFDTAASPFLYSTQVYSEVSRLVSTDRILFGSDYPLLVQNRLVAEIRASDLPDEEKEMVLSGNARRLLNI
ncbi:amidohydrolase family protein [Chloroflexota bacterium]